MNIQTIKTNEVVYPLQPITGFIKHLNDDRFLDF